MFVMPQQEVQSRNKPPRVYVKQPGTRGILLLPRLHHCFMGRTARSRLTLPLCSKDKIIAMAQDIKAELRTRNGISSRLLCSRGREWHRRMMIGIAVGEILAPGSPHRASRSQQFSRSIPTLITSAQLAFLQCPALAQVLPYRMSGIPLLATRVAGTSINRDNGM